MAPDLAIHRADIETGTAADTIEPLAQKRISKCVRAPVIELDKVEFLWTIGLFPTTCAA